MFSWSYKQVACQIFEHLYNNQIIAPALIGQSPMVYCVIKLMEKSRVFWIIVTRLRLVIYEFFSCSTNIPRGLSAYKP